MSENNFSARIKALRESLNMSQMEFAKSVGTTQTTLSSYENTDKTPSLDIIKTISIKYNVSLDWLCGLTDESKSANTVTTYSDVIKALLSIMKNENMDSGIAFMAAPHNRYLTSHTNEPFVFPYLFMNDKILYSFFKEWGDLIKLLNKGTIKDDLYQLWLTDKLKALATPLLPTNCISNNMLIKPEPPTE